ncbi:hypothetical protein [Amycolatopsis magusensis]|uniref:hypothetical protein n=1 Tax=Amycolatopsis magusensis TaxID=882444 RepID=UPI003C2AEE7C
MPLPVWEDDFPERQRRAVAAAHRLSDDDLAAHDYPVLVRAILDEHAAAPIVPRFDLKWNQERPTATPGELEAPAPSPMQIELAVPMDGAGKVLFRVPERALQSGGTNQTPMPFNKDFPTWHAAIVLTIDGGEQAWAQFEDGLRRTWQEWETALLANIETANHMIYQHRAEVTTAIVTIVAARRTRVVALRSASANLSIPLRPTPTPLITLPVKPRLLTLEQVEHSRASGVPEHTLAGNIADSLVRMITSFSHALERLPNTADRIVGENEEGIRDLLLFILNTNYDGLATGETFVGQGKTDILLRWRDKDAFIAECKFWNGPANFTAAIDQLLSYTVWRDTRIALVLFIRDRSDVSAVIDKAIECLRQHGQCLSQSTGTSADDPPEFMFASTSDARRAIRLTLLIVAIPRSVPQ